MRIPNNSIFTFDFIDSSELWLNPNTKALYISTEHGVVDLMQFMEYHVSESRPSYPTFVSNVEEMLIHVTEDSLIGIGHHNSINLIGYKRLVFTTLFFQYLNSDVPIYITQSYYSNHHNIEYNIDFLDQNFNNAMLSYNNIYLISVLEIDDDLNSLNIEYSYNYGPDDCDLDLSRLSFTEPIIPVIDTPNRANIISMLELYYKDRYDIIGSNIILKFDSVTVSNSRGLSHTIYDIYIKLNMSTTFDRLLRIEGIRCKVKLIEYISNYKFSHLFDNGWGRWSHFCFGNNTVMSNLTSMLSTSEFNFILFEALLLQLPQYLSWESIEGGPYKRIANISYGSQTTSFYLDSSRLVNKIDNHILPKLCNDIELHLVRYNLHNIYSVKNTPQLEKAICNIVINNNLLDDLNIPSDYPIQQVKNFITGEYTNIKLPKTNNSEHHLLAAKYKKIKESLPTTTFQFKGNTVRMIELIPENFEGNDDILEENKFVDNANIVLNPVIYKPIIDHINKKLNSLIIKKLPYEYNTQYINSREKSSVAQS